VCDADLPRVPRAWHSRARRRRSSGRTPEVRRRDSRWPSSRRGRSRATPAKVQIDSQRQPMPTLTVRCQAANWELVWHGSPRRRVGDAPRVADGRAASSTRRRIVTELAPYTAITPRKATMESIFPGRSRGRRRSSQQHSWRQIARVFRRIRDREKTREIGLSPVKFAVGLERLHVHESGLGCSFCCNRSRLSAGSAGLWAACSIGRHDLVRLLDVVLTSGSPLDIRCYRNHSGHRDRDVFGRGRGPRLRTGSDAASG